MKRNQDELVPLNNIYIGLQIKTPIHEKDSNVVLELTIIEKTPYYLKAKEKIDIYKDIEETKYYYLSPKDGYFIDKKVEDGYTTYKYLKPFNDVLNICAFRLKNNCQISDHDFSTYQQSVKILQELNVLDIEMIQKFKQYILGLYCFAYNNPIDQEIEQNGYYVIEEEGITNDNNKIIKFTKKNL